MKSLKTSTDNVARVMNNLNGSSINELSRAQRQLSSEIKNMTRNTGEEVAAFKKKEAELIRVRTELDRVKTQANLTSKSFSQMGAGATKTGSLMASLKGLLPVIGISMLATKAVELTKEFFNLAKEMEQTERKAKLVFGESFPKITEAARENAAQMGLVRDEYIEVAAKAGSLLNSLGFTKDATTDLTVNITNLAGALDEWTGGTMGTAQVTEILTKGIMGQTKGLKQLGITVDKTSEDYKKRVKILQEEKGITEEQAKALAMYTMIQQRSGDALLAYNEKANTLLRMQKSLVTWWRQLKDNVVEYFNVPVSEKMEDQRLKVNALTIELSNSNTQEERKRKVWDELMTIQPDILKGLDQENLDYTMLTDNLIKYNNEAINKIALQQSAEEVEKIQTEAAGKRNELLDYESKVMTNLADLAGKARNFDKERAEKIENILTSNIDILDKNSQIKDVISEINKEHGKKVMDNVTEYTYLEKITELKKIDADYTQKATDAVEKQKLQYQLLTGITMEEANAKKKAKDEEEAAAARAQVLADKLAAEAEKKKEEDEKKAIERFRNEKEYRAQVILESKPLLDQEDAAYQERKKKAGIFNKDIKTLRGEYLDAALALEKQHQENVKKIEDPNYDPKKQKEYIDQVILDAKSLVEQEDLAYQERLEQAGLFGVARETLTADQLKALEALEKQHNEKIGTITAQAINADLLENKKNFDQAAMMRETAYLNEMAALGKDEKAKEAQTKKYEKERYDARVTFLTKAIADLQGAMAGEDTFVSIDEKLLSPEDLAAFKANIAELQNELAKLDKDKPKEDKKETGFQKFMGGDTGDKVDILGMSGADWKTLIQNIQDGNIGFEEIEKLAGAVVNTWKGFYDIKNNLDQQDLQRTEANIEKQKASLKKKLDTGVISQEAYNNDIAKLDASLDAKKKEVALNAAKRERNIALMNAVVNTAAGIAKMLNNPWPLNLILAALVGVMGGIEIAKIVTTSLPQAAAGKYDVIGAQDGKKYNAKLLDSPGTGLVKSPAIIVGEQPEIIIDPYTTRNLQVNFPEVIQAINFARMPQYASGKYTSDSFAKTGKSISILDDLAKAISELKNTTLGLQNTTANMQASVEKLTKQGVIANLITNSEYIVKHNKIAEDYKECQKQSSLQG